MFRFFLFLGVLFSLGFSLLVGVGFWIRDSFWGRSCFSFLGFVVFGILDKEAVIFIGFFIFREVCCVVCFFRERKRGKC